jgi:hypothetical protein
MSIQKRNCNAWQEQQVVRKQMEEEEGALSVLSYRVHNSGTAHSAYVDGNIGAIANSFIVLAVTSLRTFPSALR